MKNTLTLRSMLSRIAIASAAVFAAIVAQAALAQDYYFIDHKPSSMRLQVCAGDDGKPVGTGEREKFIWSCVQFEKIMRDDGFFHIRSVDADKFLTPASQQSGADIVINPTSWTGDWTQWSHLDTGDGYGRLVHKYTGKFIFAGGDRHTVQLQPTSWTGDYTRFKFTPVNGMTPTPSMTPSPSPTPSPTPRFDCSPLPLTVSFEAEEGQLFGSARPYDDVAASGGEGVAFISSVGAGFSLEVNNIENVNQTTVFYASELSGSITYSINGVNVGKIPFESTGAWEGAYDRAVVSLRMNPSDTFAIQFENGDTAMNVDAVEFFSPGSCVINPTPPPPTPLPTDEPTPPPAGDMIVDFSSTPELGTFLVAGDFHPKAGFTLYTFDNDEAGPSVCFDGCASVWPPFLVESASEVVAPAGVSLGTSARPDGTVQVTLNNEPLYFYTPDTNVGDTTGHLVGGVWHVADVDVGVTPTPFPTDDPTPRPRPSGDPTPPPTIPPTDGEFCLSTDGVVSHLDLPFRANYHFLCLNGNCQPASLNSGVWEFGFGPVDPNATYEIKTQLDHVPVECGMIANVQPGQCVVSECFPPDEEAPSVPANLNGEGRNGTAVSLTWNASTDNRAVAYYEIFRNGSLAGTSKTNSYNDAGLDELTSYSYKVRACDAAPNCSSDSSEIDVDTGVFVPDTEAPTVPNGLSTAAMSETELQLTWNASTDAAGVVAQYIIYRDGSQVATQADTTFLDSGLSTGGSYSYQVVACDDSENCSARSSTAVGETLKPDFSYLNWTYNKHDSTDVVLGISMTNHNGNLVGPEARNDGPDFLPTPTNGSPASSHGFAFDINGSQLSWRWGGSIFKGAGDSGLEMFCSEDGGITYSGVAISGGTATIPCSSSDYVYFFRYVHPLALNDNPASAYIYTAPFTIASRVNPLSYTPFTDGSANWMRMRHPVSHDGNTAAVIDAQHNGDRLRHLDRYIIYVDDAPGNVQLNIGLQGNLVRNDVQRNNAGTINGQQQFSLTQNPGFGNAFSYGQTIQFELTAVAGATGAQTYNDFSYYQVGYGWNAYGDPRLNSAGKAGTTMWLSDTGTYSALEYNAIFTQPVTTLNTEQDVDDFIVGHHLFHGVDPGKNGSDVFDDPDVQIGERTCGNCHFRDGRGSEIINTPRGPRIAPPTYGVKLLEAIAGREVGFRWDGGSASVAEQVVNALEEDHKVNPDHLPTEVIDLITAYTEMLTVPNRDPGSYDDPSVVRGDALFNQIGCADCHTPIQKTRADVAAPWANLTIRPYTDMKAWDLGEGSFRTAPLWGLGHNLDLLSRNNRAALFMHDGGSTSIDDAINRHNGSGASAKANYSSLSGADKQAIVDFVRTL